MSLLKHAERCIANQHSFKTLNAFIPLTQDSLASKNAARAADERQANGQAKSPIDGRLIAVKDNICTARQHTTCASNILRGFQSPFPATVVERLEEAGAFVTGKTNLDEFGMGSHSTHSAFGIVQNARSTPGTRMSAGGSSGGSAVAVASNQCWAALGTDTGGSVRLPAAYNGIVGFKPSYGLVSRHGVVAYANSLDTVGIMASSSGVVRQVFDAINWHDEMDPTSLDPAVRSQIREENYKLKRSNGLRIGVPTEHNISELEPDVRRAWIKALQLLEHLGHSIHHVSLPSTKIALSAYYVIAPAEASSNLAKYDGVRYGNQSNSPCEPEGVLYASTRGNQLGEEVKRRILLGAYSLSASAIDNYFLQAQRVRRLVQQDFDAVFRRSNPLSNSAPRTQKTGVDVLLAPTATSLPPSLDSLSKGSVIDTYKDDVLTVPASLAGLPAMSVPVGRSVEDTSSLSESLDLPELPKSLIGLQIIAQYGDDDLVFHVAQLFDEHGRLGSAAG